jgi:phage repressor protein C with HTH and peptisase S24 domain
MDYADKIKLLRVFEDKNQTTFAEETGIPLSTLKKVEAGISNAGFSLVEKIIQHPSYQQYALWFLLGQTATSAKQFSPLEPASECSNLNDWHSDDYVNLPFYEVAASAGVGLLAEVEEYPRTISFEPNWLRNEIGVCPNNVFLMLVDGDSMQPTLKNGSMIMVNRDVDNLSDGIYVMRYDNNLLVKRLQMLPGGIIRVKSDNSMYDPWEINKSQLDGEELALIGRVVWTGQKM